MSLTTTPRVEIVGSFLPPEELEQALQQKSQGAITVDELHAIEDRVIDSLIDTEIEAGLQIVTDGELRRKAWDRDFFEGLNGIDRKRIDSGSILQDAPLRRDTLAFDGRIAYNPEHPFLDKFSHMVELTKGRAEARQTMPSPGELYMRIMLETNGEPGKIYSSPETLKEDIIEAYRATIAELYRRGCRHIQFDSSVWTRLSDPDFERTLLLGGMDSDVICATLTDIINRTVAGRPADLEITLSAATNHTHFAQLDNAPEQRHIINMLENVDVDAFLIPFDVRYPHHISVLSHIPGGKRAILGLVDASNPGLESITDIIEAINVAARHVLPELISISPTSGFKVANRELQGLNFESQWTKIALLKEAAKAWADQQA